MPIIVSLLEVSAPRAFKHMDDTANALVERFDLKPHPEGGFYREVYRSDVILNHPGIPAGRPSERRSGSMIYYLLGPEDFSAFHRVRWTDEIWHLYAGGPLQMHIIDDRGRHSAPTLSRDFSSGEPICIVPAGSWQAARPAPGVDWVFGGCTVSPGFEFADFEMPARDKLLRMYPSHATLIETLTRR